MLGADGDSWALLWSCSGSSLLECWEHRVLGPSDVNGAAGLGQVRGPGRGQGGLNRKEAAASCSGLLFPEGKPEWGGEPRAASSCSHRLLSQPLVCFEGLACHTPPPTCPKGLSPPPPSERKESRDSWFPWGLQGP